MVSIFGMKTAKLKKKRNDMQSYHKMLRISTGAERNKGQLELAIKNARLTHLIFLKSKKNLNH